MFVNIKGVAVTRVPVAEPHRGGGGGDGGAVADGRRARGAVRPTAAATAGRRAPPGALGAPSTRTLLAVDRGRLELRLPRVGFRHIAETRRRATGPTWLRVTRFRVL